MWELQLCTQRGTSRVRHKQHNEAQKELLGSLFPSFTGHGSGKWANTEPPARAELWGSFSWGRAQGKNSNTPEEQQNSQLLPARPKGVPGNVAARATAKPAPPAPKQSPEEWESSFCPSPPNKATPRFCRAKTQLRPSPKHQLCSGKARNELTEVVEQGRTGITALACGASPHLPGVFLGTFTFPAPRQIFPALRVKGLAELPCPGQQGWLLCYLFLDKHCHSRDIPGVSKGPWAQLLCPIATAASHRAIKGFYTFLNGEREKSKKKNTPTSDF